jgi:hypothetical protein
MYYNEPQNMRSERRQTQKDTSVQKCPERKSVEKESKLVVARG